MDAKTRCVPGSHAETLAPVATRSGIARRGSTRSGLRLAALAAAAIVSTLGWTGASAADPEFALAIRNHRFEPAELTVPADQRIRLVVGNEDKTPEEFESKTLNREKLVPPGNKVTIFIGPLKPGRYEFFGEYNEATARGAIVVK